MSKVFFMKVQKCSCVKNVFFLKNVPYNSNFNVLGLQLVLVDQDLDAESGPDPMDRAQKFENPLILRLWRLKKKLTLKI